MANSGSFSEHLILDGKLCNGIQDVSFDAPSPENTQSFIGTDDNRHYPISAPKVTAKVNKLLLNQDFITGLVKFTNAQNEATGFSGAMIYGDNKMSFKSGVLDGFSVSASTNDIPEISYDFTIYDALTGESENILAHVAADSPKDIIPITGISVTFDKTGTIDNGLNAIKSMTFSEAYNYQVNYAIGQTGAPVSIKLLDPIVQRATIEIEAEDYIFEDNYRAFTSNNVTNRDIALEVRSTGNVVNRYSMSGASLVSESINTQVGSTMSATLQYKGHKKVND
jgi:hypothetical protein|tara:strand:- start:532 stop:1374 length:843 start_codon:yes stop_codon:yes gene_type:complete